MFKRKRKAFSVILPQVHPVVQAGNLIAVAIEHQGFDALSEK
jgi:hypothetical protein